MENDLQDATKLEKGYWPTFVGLIQAKQNSKY
jgi:hypothetical protein